MTDPSTEHGRLLQAILRLGVSDAPAPAAPAAWGEADWRAFVRAADHHGVGTLVGDIARRRAPGLLPAVVAEHMAAHLRNTAARNLAVARDLVAIVRALDAAGIRVLLLKGLALSHATYGNLGLRSAGDIDLVVAPGDAVGAAKIIEGLGYAAELTATGAPFSAARLSIDYECHFERAGGTPVDLHWGLAPWYMGFREDFGELWQRRASMQFAGVSIAVPGRADLLWYLAVHGSRHLWCRWIWLCDVALVASQASEAELAEAQQLARVRGNAAFARGGYAAVAHLLTGAAVDAAGKRALRPMLAVAEKCLVHRHAPPSNNVDFALCHMRMLDSPRAKATCAKHLVENAARSPGLVFRATEEDRRAVPLPRWLHFAYPAVRPVRLALRRGRR